MKKYYLIALLGFVLVWSCNSDTEKTDNKNDTEVQEPEKNNKVVDNKKDNEEKKIQEPQINEQFKAFLSKFSKASLPYNENPQGNEEYPKISMDEQVAYLSKAEKLSAADLKDMKDYTDFYYVSNPLNTNKFHAIVYGRFEMGSTYYFLCTYDNDGKLISNIDFAAYELIGAGPQAGQEYNTKGSIDKNYEVIVKSSDETRKYKIQEDGKIVRM